jgi:hypothetical protein
MENGSVLAEAIYNLCDTKWVGVFKGCASEPEHLSKCLARRDVSMLNYLITGSDPSIKETNAVEETTFVTIGYPPCWKDDKKLYFIRDSEEIDLPD